MDFIGLKTQVPYLSIVWTDEFEGGVNL
jgi:hypothetical protein